MPRRPPTPPSFSPPLPADQHLVHLLAPQGSNNFLCADTDGAERLVELNSKLRRIKSLIVMRGDFAIIALFPPGTTDKDKGGRLVGEILHMLDKGDIREWKKAGAWPEGFGEQPAPISPDSPESGEEYSNSDEEEDQDEDAQGHEVDVLGNRAVRGAEQGETEETI